MSINSADEEYLSPRTLDETKSPRKRMRLDNSARKSWSLMDKKTDQEVLQEMGVSLLEQDECEGICDAGTSGLNHKSMKRKRDIENVNPNVNSSLTSPWKFSPKSPRIKCSPSPGPSKAPSPWSGEKAVKHTDLDLTLIEPYAVDEETPLAQSVSAGYMGPGFNAGPKRQSLTPLSVEDDQSITLGFKCEPAGEDTFNILSDEMILSVFKWMPKRTTAHCMLVCKRWYRVACDETLWQRLDLGNKTLNKDALGRILARKPTIVRLSSSEIGEWHPSTPPTPSRIQYLDLSMSTIDLDTLDCLLERCPALRKLSVESVCLRDDTCRIIGKCKNLETLNLTMAQGITADGLSALLNGCTGLLSLNISWCSLDEAGLSVLVAQAPERLQRLNTAGARIMTDDMVVSLTSRCRWLVELDLSDCGRLGPSALGALRALQRLEHLALSRCYLLPPRDIAKLNSMTSLQYLELWGVLPSTSLNTLKATMPSIQVNQFMFSAIARPTVGTRRTSIWGLRTRD